MEARGGPSAAKVGRGTRAGHIPGMLDRGTRHILPWAIAFVALGCAAPPPPKAPRPAPATASAEPTPEGNIARSALDDILAKGPGELTDLVPVEDAMDGNTFVGWRILAMPRGWDEAGLQPGDVVTAVNGMSLSRPEELWNVWSMLGVASEIKIAYRRDGEHGEITLPVWGEPDPAVAKTLGSGASALPEGSEPPPLPVRPPEDKPRHKPTIVIAPEPRPLSETNSWEE